MAITGGSAASGQSVLTARARSSAITVAGLPSFEILNFMNSSSGIRRVMTLHSGTIRTRPVSASCSAGRSHLYTSSAG